MPRVSHFEINADEPVRAARFYRDLFGWEITKWEGPVEYWLIVTGPETEPGINGGLMKRMPGTSTVNTIVVDSVDNYLKKVKSAGGKIVVPKQTIPGIGYQAYVTDTEGNVFGLHQTDMNAK